MLSVPEDYHEELQDVKFVSCSLEVHVQHH